MPRSDRHHDGADHPRPPGVRSLHREGHRLGSGPTDHDVRTTTSYPYALIGIAWLVIQIPLLGLYRRRRSGPEDPLESDFEALLLPPADYGVDSVREMVGGYPSQAPDDDPLDTIVVSGSSRRGRR